MARSFYIFKVDEGKLTAGKDWKILFEKRLDEMPFEYERFRNSIRFWGLEDRVHKTAREDITYRDGYEVFQLPQGRDQAGALIGFNFRRLYFKGSDEYPAAESAAELFKRSATPPVLRQLPLIPPLDAFIAAFNRQSHLLSEVEDLEWGCVGHNISLVGDERYATVSELSQESYSREILKFVRNGKAIKGAPINLILIDSFTSNKSLANSIATQTANVLEREWGCRVSRRKVSTSNDLNALLNAPLNANSIGFIALDGQKGERPPQQVIEWMRFLNESRIPFVIFSASSSVSPTYTRHGNATHLLSKAGGYHFAVQPSSVSDYENHWFIGLDLGIGAQYRGKCVVVTLTDAAGTLRCYWRALKDSDETLTPELLHEAVNWICTKAEELSPGRNYFVIRDGRCPHNEKHSTYRELLPEGKTTFVEYQKRGNPLMLENAGQPQPGTFAQRPNSKDTYLFTARAPQQGMITNTCRFRTPINDLGYSPAQICEILTAQCFVPTLSFQPSSLPAPIYWADGIASLSYTNLQFSGWKHLPQLTKDFRQPHRERVQ